MTDEWAPSALATLRTSMDRMVEVQLIPGGAVAAGTLTSEPGFATVGVTTPGGSTPVRVDTMYDVASLTKVVGTWPLIGRAIADGLLDLNAPVAKHFPAEWAGPGGEVTVRQILTHTSGLMASTRLDQYVGDPREVAEAILAEPLEAPGGHRYINRGFILLGLLLARVHGRPLRQLLEEVDRDVDLVHFTYGAVHAREYVAPTERRLLGGEFAHGVVHDENAALLGGAAGHAGVFASAHALARYARELLRAHEGTGSLAALREYVTESWRPAVRVDDSTSRGLAWLVRDDGLVYHHGFTGTSLYLDPARGRYLVVLTNAIAYGRDRTGLAPLRDLAARQFSNRP